MISSKYREQRVLNFMRNPELAHILVWKWSSRRAEKDQNDAIKQNVLSFQEVIQKFKIELTPLSLSDRICPYKKGLKKIWNIFLLQINRNFGAGRKSTF